MHVLPATTPEQFDHIHALYLTAFPENERKSFTLMQDLMKKGLLDIVFFETDDQPFIGFAILAIHDQTMLVDYLAINPDYRGKGYGSTAIEWLIKEYPLHKICLEIESTNVDSDNPQERINRKEFYLKNKLTMLPFEAEVFEVRFELLANDTAISPEEFVAIYHNVYGPHISKNVSIIDAE
ncbi:GNAT family N-acetyltransferase [Jeotgalibaca porci]|uniref:GNAT family N-acetyltransferase n=1 Tax=Jeotgalibaca porci TaxID=1868793 RepID=UPI0035A09C72